MSHRCLPALTVAVAAVALTGCGQTLEERVATAVITSALETTRNGGAARELVELKERDENGCISDPVAAAADAASRPTNGLFPEGCLAKTAEGSELHAQFDGCTGVFGKVTLRGGMDAHFEPTGECQMHADIWDSGDFTANDRPLDYEAGADVYYRDGYRDVDWSAHWKGTTKRGREVEQTSSLNVRADEESNCLDIVGTTNGHVDEWQFGTVIEGLAICPGECPSAGVVEAHLEGKHRDRSLTVEFDGSTVARVTGWSGNEFDVDMVCGAVEDDPS